MGGGSSGNTLLFHIEFSCIDTVHSGRYTTSSAALFSTWIIHQTAEESHENRMTDSDRNSRREGFGSTAADRKDLQNQLCRVNQVPLVPIFDDGQEVLCLFSRSRQIVLQVVAAFFGRRPGDLPSYSAICRKIERIRRTASASSMSLSRK